MRRANRIANNNTENKIELYGSYHVQGSMNNKTQTQKIG